MKYILLPVILLIISSGCFCQTPTTFYFDKDMNIVSRSNAVFTGTGEMDDGLYKLTCYDKNKSNIAFIAHYTDSAIHEHQGMYRSYYANGNSEKEGVYNKGEKDGLWKTRYKDGALNDSILYDKGIQVINATFHYFPDNHLQIAMFDNVKNEEFHYTTYDESGKVIDSALTKEDYANVFFQPETEPEFPGGPKAWSHYIGKQLENSADELDDNIYGTSLVRFLIDTSGNVSEVTVLTMKGSDFATIVLKAIIAGPSWVPAQQHGKKVKTYRIQPVTIAKAR